MYLIVGLGNPGREYEHTRHNMGFMCIDAIADKYQVTFSKEKFGGIYGEFQYHGEKVYLLKPQRYINLSGEVIKQYVDYFKIPIENILIIHDDLDLEFGKIKIKYKGRSGGHNGLKDIERHLKTQNYRRIKLGISNDKMMNTKDYVLGKISQDSTETLNCVINTVCLIFEDYFVLSFDNLMNKYNKK